MHEFESGARAGLTHFVARLTTIEEAARTLADLIDDEDTGLTEARDTLLAVL